MNALKWSYDELENFNRRCLHEEFKYLQDQKKQNLSEALTRYAQAQIEFHSKASIINE
jgi:hypothetical protein